ncbi:MAG: AEC family transporter [Deltaproteobacteria bacterium]|nr:AEC family transporter [Deltaproteobacteria bacterium]
MGHFEAIISINLPILLGYLIRKTDLFSMDEVGTLRKFVIQVTVPFIIFKNLYKADISSISQIAPSATALLVMCILFVSVSIGVSRVFKSPVQRNSFVIGTMFGNYGYLGWGVMYGFYGDNGFSRAVFFTILSWPVFLVTGFAAIWILSRKNKTDGQGSGFFVRLLLKNSLAPVLSATAAMSMNYFSVGLPRPFWNTVSSFGNITIPLILFTIGLSFRFRAGSSRFGVILTGSIFRVIPGILTGLITIFIVSLIFKMDLITRKMILIQSVMPTATVSAFFAEFIESDEEVIAAILTWSTLGALLTIPLWYTAIEKTPQLLFFSL